MSEFRNRVLMPLSVAMGAAVVVGLFAFALSRILLAVPEAGSTIIAFLLAGMIVAVISVFALTGSSLKQSQKILVGVTGFAVLGAGIAAGAMGVREVHGHLEEIEIAAENIAFDTDTLVLPPETEIALVFANRDAGVDHNVEIFTDDTFSGDPLFRGEIFPGVATMSYEVPPIAEGTYAFRCVVHPPMEGIVVVGEEGAAGDHAAPEPADEPTEDAAPPSDAAEVSLSATGLDFSTTELDFPADTPVALTFDITDEQSHNVSIYEDDTYSGEPIFRGEFFPGPDSMTYAIPAIAAGEYAFRCDVHPADMTGTLTVS